MENTNATTKANWADLMVQAITKPGLLEQSFRAFHRYSVGNRLYAMFQCRERGITPGPLSTFRQWIDKGRHVRKGEKALRLLMPIEVGKNCDCQRCEPSSPAGKTCRRGRVFVEKARWFVLSQTEGQAAPEALPPTWSKTAALAALKITEAPFALTDGNVQGYASGRTVRVSPLAQFSAATLFHELAHVVLGHTEHTVSVAKDVREAEAETVAMILCETLGLPGAEYCRGYIQSWLGADRVELFRQSAGRIFQAADAILNAGAVIAAAAEELGEAA